MLALPLLGLAAWSGGLAEPRRVLAVVVMAVLGYGPWLCAFSVLRYALVLEATASLLIVVVIVTITRAFAPRRRFLAPTATAIVLGALLWHTEPPDYWRVPYGKRVFEIDPIKLQPNSMVLVINGPVALALPFFEVEPPGYQAVGLVYREPVVKRLRPV